MMWEFTVQPRKVTGIEVMSGYTLTYNNCTQASTRFVENLGHLSTIVEPLFSDTFSSSRKKVLLKQKTLLLFVGMMGEHHTWEPHIHHQARGLLLLNRVGPLTGSCKLHERASKSLSFEIQVYSSYYVFHL
jgi:hypothetical protein